MRTHIATTIATLALSLTVLACGGSTETCPPITLLAPDGSPYDISGTWRGNDTGVYYVKQLDSCVWWSGMSDFEGQYPGEAWIMTFRGHVTETGRISGDFVDVKSTNPGTGTLTIDLRPDATSQILGMYKVDQTGHPVGVSTWKRESEFVAPPTDDSVIPGLN
ncbi:MAG: hypothetical protein ABIP53_04710 [Candidatus Limnocylindrales bacterium]